MPNREAQSRHDRIFDIVVRSYIETAEPVASMAISKKHDVGLSSASIRNVMADLEENGLLKQPHTSAGRIPTDKGYRYYVDNLMEPEVLSPEEKSRFLHDLGQVRSIETLVDRVSKLVSKLTGSVAVVYVKNMKRVSFLNYLLEDLIESQKLLDFFEEEQELIIEGLFRMFEQPEFQDARKMRLVLQTFDEKYGLLQILLRDLNEEGVQVHIGRENALGELEDVSMIVKDWYLGGVPIGGVAVIGPTRMHYEKVIPMVDYVADTISEAVGRF